MTKSITCPNCGSEYVVDGIAERLTFLHCVDCYTEWDESKRKPVNAWISCDERLPEERVDVLVYDGEDIYTDWLIDADERSWGNLEEITHWQPLPEPPAAGKDGE